MTENEIYIDKCQNIINIYTAVKLLLEINDNDMMLISPDLRNKLIKKINSTFK